MYSHPRYLLIKDNIAVIISCREAAKGLQQQQQQQQEKEMVRSSFFLSVPLKTTSQKEEEKRGESVLRSLLVSFFSLSSFSKKVLAYTRR